MKRVLTAVCLVLAIAALAPRAGAVALTTAFTYQGSIDRSGVAPTDSCTFVFKLFDALSLGTQLGPTITTPVTLLENGQFSITLDFGVGMFDGNQRWLDILVHCPGDLSPTPLTPRQAITATPYAIYALSGPGSGGGFALPYTGAVTTSTQNAFRIQNNATTGDGTAILGVSSSDYTFAAGVKGVGVSPTGNSVGVWGWATASPVGTGVAGQGSATGGYFASTDAASPGADYAGVYGVANAHPGVKGVSTTGFGVFGYSSSADGLYGRSSVGRGVSAASDNNDGVAGYTYTNVGTSVGVYGNTSSTNINSAGVRGEGTQATGVEGVSQSGAGVYGHSSASIGVSGSSPSYFGVLGVSGSQAGVKGISGSAQGVYGQSSASGNAGVFGTNTSAGGYGGWFQNTGGGVALYANGLAQVKTMQILGADLAESFPVEGDGAEPGTVLAIAGEGEGTLRVCGEAYCTRVAGVVSGAHGLPAGVVLKGTAFDEAGHAAVAMSGRVWVKCDATHDAIRVGDLLTTAARAGHAMRAADPARSTGAILGKAMTSLESGTGLVLVLVSLQ